MIMVSIMVTNVVLNRLNNYENSDARFYFRRWLQAVWAGRYALAIPIIIWGGIYSGVFTPTEAAAAAVVVTITIGLWQGTLTLADFPKMLEVVRQGERRDRADHRLRRAARPGARRAQRAASHGAKNTPNSPAIRR